MAMVVWANGCAWSVYVRNASLSLSLSLYIYIYIYIYLFKQETMTRTIQKARVTKQKKRLLV